MTADITSDIFVYEQEDMPNRSADSPFEYKEIMVETPATADDGDVFDITLANYGITNVKSITGYTHSTSNSVIIVEDPTTVVSAGVLTVTIGGSTDNKMRVFVIGGY